MIRRIDHLTVNVKDIEKSVYFYQELLGLKKAETIDMGDHTLTYMEMPGGIKLELIDYEDDTGMETGSCMKKGMLRHLALEVDNIRELAEKLHAYQCIFHMELSYVEKLKSLRMLTEDPNGVELEFIENVGGETDNAEKN